MIAICLLFTKTNFLLPTTLTTAQYPRWRPRWPPKNMKSPENHWMLKISVVFNTILHVFHYVHVVSVTIQEKSRILKIFLIFLLKMTLFSWKNGQKWRFFPFDLISFNFRYTFYHFWTILWVSLIRSKLSLTKYTTFYGKNAACVLHIIKKWVG